MSGFVRVKLLEYQSEGNSYVSRGNDYVAVKIKEAVKTPNGVELMQKRRTMNQEWSSFFDSHLYDGRVVHMLVMDRVSERAIAETSVGIHILASHCRQTGEQPVDLLVSLTL
jgi:novel protein kinase C delta type